MKILIAAGIYPPDSGGPAIHAKAQFEGLPKHGIETRLVALAHFRAFPKGVSHLLYFLKLLISARGTNLIYAHDAFACGFPAYLTSFILNKKLILRIGGDIAWEKEALGAPIPMLEWYAQGKHRQSRIFTLSKWLLKKAEVVIVPSSILKEIYVSYYKISPEKIQIIANPIPEVKNIQTECQPKVVFASRLVAYKNLEMVLRVFKGYPQLSLVIMGDGPERKSLEKQKSDNIKFLGNVSQEIVIKETSSCLLTLAPALTEFNPNYVLQGISLGKPFLISRENGLPFEVSDEFIFNPRSEEDLRVKLSNFLDKDFYRQSVEKVRTMKTLSWHDNLKANAEVIKSLV